MPYLISYIPYLIFHILYFILNIPYLEFKNKVVNNQRNGQPKKLYNNQHRNPKQDSKPPKKERAMPMDTAQK